MNQMVRSLGNEPGLATIGGIDCDLHPASPATATLLPYLDDYWRETFVMRGVDRMSLAMTASPPRAPINVRADWKAASGFAGDTLEAVRAQALDPFGTRLAICNVLHGSMIMHSDDMAAALCGAVNEWLAQEWLDKEPRLRGSIIVSAQNAELAVAEIEKRAADNRFVQVMILAQNDEPLGRRRYWPIYEAAARNKLPLCIHAGGSNRHAPTATGWPSFFVEAYVAQGSIFESQLLSLIAEGVFHKVPDLKVVFAESGFTWLPSFFWRADKTWRGVRAETLGSPNSRATSSSGMSVSRCSRSKRRWKPMRSPARSTMPTATTSCCFRPTIRMRSSRAPMRSRPGSAKRWRRRS